MQTGALGTTHTCPAAQTCSISCWERKDKQMHVSVLAAEKGTMFPWLVGHVHESD